VGVGPEECNSASALDYYRTIFTRLK